MHAAHLVDLVEGERRHILDDHRVEGGGDAEIVLGAERPSAELVEFETRDGVGGGGHLRRWGWEGGGEEVREERAWR